MHISFGMPLISAEHDPHLPALQFQRQARSLACVAWISCTASSTTMPSTTSCLYSTNSPFPFSPRQILNVRDVVLRRRVLRRLRRGERVFGLVLS